MNEFESLWQKNLQSRFQDRVEAYLKIESPNLIICHDDDAGVRLNGGRAGARLAPKALVNVFKKLTANSSIKESGIKVASLQTKFSMEQFLKSQELCTKEITELLQQGHPQQLLQLGGGHDHIYPLLMALQQDQKIQRDGLFILNIDAHLDTRVDPIASSGTPFRQWAQQSNIPFHLVQVGIHPFANPDKNYQRLSKGRMDILEGPKHNDLIQKIETLRELGPTPSAQIIISLDADALNSSCMSAVSAVNHDGLSLEVVEQMQNWALNRSTRRIMGIYEYNPLFDDLSQKGARALVKLMDNFFRASK
jgi:formiminoglutamase